MPKKPEVEIFSEHKAAKDDDHVRVIFTLEDKLNPPKTVLVALYSDELIIQGSKGIVTTLKYQDY